MSRFRLPSLLLSLLALSACDPELKNLRYRTWHDPFDTIPRGKDHPISDANRLALQSILGRAKSMPVPREGARYSPGFPPTGTAFVALDDSTDRICDCWPDRITCKAEPERVIAKPDLPAYRSLLARIDAEARSLDSAERAGAAPR